MKKYILLAVCVEATLLLFASLGLWLTKELNTDVFVFFIILCSGTLLLTLNSLIEKNE